MRDKVLAEDGYRPYSTLIEDAPHGLVNVPEFWDSDVAWLTHLKQPLIVDVSAKFRSHLRSSTVQI